MLHFFPQRNSALFKEIKNTVNKDFSRRHSNLHYDFAAQKWFILQSEHFMSCQNKHLFLTQFSFLSLSLDDTTSKHCSFRSFSSPFLSGPLVFTSSHFGFPVCTLGKGFFCEKQMSHCWSVWMPIDQVYSPCEVKLSSTCHQNSTALRLFFFLTHFISFRELAFRSLAELLFPYIKLRWMQLFWVNEDLNWTKSQN